MSGARGSSLRCTAALYCPPYCLQPPNFQFHDPQGPIYTSPRFLPPAKVIKSKLTDAIVSHGSYLRECDVNHAIIGLRSRIMENVTIQVQRRRCGGGGGGAVAGVHTTGMQASFAGAHHSHPPTRTPTRTPTPTPTPTPACLPPPHTHTCRTP